MLNAKRIKELQDFTDDFKNNLSLAEKRYEDSKLQTMQHEKEQETRKGRNNCISEPSLTANPSPNGKKPKYSCELFKEPPYWKPTSGFGHYFGNFKLPKMEHALDPWEIHRINLLKRSYEKQENMLDGKNFVCREQAGKEFEDYLKKISITESLSSVGAKIIGSFIKDNQKREQLMWDKDKEIYNFRHSKPPMDINPWKYSNHIITEFSVPPGSKVVSFKKESREKCLITSPYRIPKKDGDYFDKDFKRLY